MFLCGIWYLKTVLRDYLNFIIRFVLKRLCYTCNGVHYYITLFCNMIYLITDFEFFNCLHTYLTL